ncbi:hypothetical protein [Pontibacter beigongshangensis]|uniref:hypothetical protein n=1 Tax=Pontibacter beigongshangensis TaxID=2574733 RepID=UPI0016506F2C|nr:hypothetical protein [Pontibacter beigongshangensis]
MTEYIKQYYHSERSMALLAAAIGLAFLIIAWVAFRQPGSGQLYRGLTYTLVVSGLLFLSGLGALLQSDKKMEEVSNYTQSNRELQVSELQRIEKVLATGYRISTILASIAVLAGVVLLLFNSGNLHRGIGLGILLFGTALHALDFFSINKHKIYYESIKALKL